MSRHTGIALFVSFLLLAAFPSSAWAADFRAGEGPQDVSGRVDDDVYIAGDAISVSGEVTGDVFAAGRSVRLSGSAGQSFFAGAQNVTITGRVGNSARIGSQTIEVTGTVARDLLAGAQTITIAPEGSVGRDVVSGSQSLEIAGDVAGNVKGGAGSLIISGTVGGDVDVESENVTLEDGARVQGDLVYTSDNEADISPGAVIGGRIIRNEPRAEGREEERSPLVEAVLDFLRGAAGAFVLGLVLLWLVPDLLPVLARTIRNSPLPSLGVGLAALFLVPIVAALIFIPAVVLGAFGSLPFLLLAVYGILLTLAKAAVGYLLGLQIVRRNGDAAPAPSFRDDLKALAVGVVLLALLTAIPFLGGLIGFLAAILTLGAGIVALANWRKARGGPAAPRPGAVADGSPDVTGPPAATGSA